MDLYRIADTYYKETISGQLQGLPFTEQIFLFFREYCQIAENNGVELIQKMYVPDNTLFLGRTQGMRHVLLETIEQAVKAGTIEPDAVPGDSEDLSLNAFAEKTADDLFLVARGVIFDWALRNGEYALKEKMNDMLAVYLKHIKRL